MSIRELADCEAFADLQKAVLSDLEDVGREVAYQPEERLVSLLGDDQRAHILLEGLAKLVGVSTDGVERILYVYRSCEVIGASVFMDEATSGYEVVAMLRCRALVVSRAEVLRLGDRHPELLVALTKDFTRQLGHMTERMMSAVSSDSSVRLGQLLLEFTLAGHGSNEMVPLNHPLTQETMGQIIGSSRPHTSTLLRQFEEHGAVKRQGARGIMVRRGRLREILEAGGLVHWKQRAADSAAS